jgi:hypothetical protein
MGSHKWPCPNCGQEQKAEVPNGVEVKAALCAACSEKYLAAQEEILVGSGTKASKEKALDALDAQFRLPQDKSEKAQSAEAV